MNTYLAFFGAQDGALRVRADKSQVADGRVVFTKDGVVVATVSVDADVYVVR